MALNAGNGRGIACSLGRVMGRLMFSNAILPPGALRLVLACMVLVSHYAFLSGRPLATPIDGPAVMGFFFLSGYWVRQRWRDKYASARSPLVAFYISRAWRVYPLALLSVVFTCFAIGKLPNPSDFILIGLNLGTATNPPMWSLATELQFYLVAPLLFALLRSRIAIAAVLIAGAAGWLLFALRVTNSTWLPTFILPLALGAIYAETEWRASRTLALASLASFIALNVALWFFGQAIEIRLQGIILSGALFPYIAASLGHRSEEVDRTLGNLAYPVFLLHWGAFYLSPNLVGAVLLTAVLSLAAERFIDRRLEKRRHLFEAGKSGLTSRYT